MKKRLKKADDLHDVKAKMLEIINNSDKLLENYLNLYQDLNDLYNNYPNVYEEIQRVVKLPTNEDADNVTKFNQDLKKELQYLNDEDFLQSVMNDNSLDAPEGNDEEE